MRKTLISSALSVIATLSLVAISSAQDGSKTSLSTEEASLVEIAAKIQSENVEKSHAEAVENRNVDENATRLIQSSRFLMRALANGEFPSVAPEDPTALRRWLYLWGQAVSAVSVRLGVLERAKDTVEANRYFIVQRKLGMMYEEAVAATEDSTLQSWGYFYKKYSNDFVADPVVNNAWFDSVSTAAIKYRSRAAKDKLEIASTIAENEKVSGELKFRVEIKTPNVPTKVELYVQDELRATSESVPFFFTIDALDEAEGANRLRLVGYDDRGERIELVVPVVVDNGANLGAAAHVEKGRLALAGRDYAAAQRSARAALRIDAQNNDALALMAMASYKRGQIDLAEKFALDLHTLKPNAILSNEILASVNIFKVFNLRSRGNRDLTANAIREALVSAPKQRKLVIEARAEVEASQAEGNPIAIADAFIRANRFSRAIDAVKPVVDSSALRDSAASERYAYCLLRLGRFDEARDFLRRVSKIGTMTNYLKNLRIVTLEQTGYIEESDALLASHTFDQSLAGQIARVIVSQRKRDKVGLNQALSSLGKIDSTSPVTNFYALQIGWERKDFNQQQDALKYGLTREPAAYDLYLEQGIRLMMQSANRGTPVSLSIAKAKPYLQAALEAKPDSGEALTAMALLLLFDNKVGEAYNFAVAATKAAPKYACGWLVLSATEQTAAITGAPAKAQEWNRKAEASLAQAKKLELPYRDLYPERRLALDTYLRIGRSPVFPVPGF